MSFNPDLKTLDELAVECQDEDYYLIEHLFPIRGLAIVSGKPGTGKTTFVLQALFSCISEQKFLNKTTNPCELLYWVQDGVETAQKRMQSYKRIFGIPNDMVRVSKAPFDLSERRDADLNKMIKAINRTKAANDSARSDLEFDRENLLIRLYKLTQAQINVEDVYRQNIKYQKAIRLSPYSDLEDFKANYVYQECPTLDSVKPDTKKAPMVVVIDTAAAFNTRENESGHFVPNIQRIIKECKCLVILVDHVGKDSSRGTRGSSSKEGAADQVISIEKERGSSLGRYKVVKDRNQPEGYSGSYEIKAKEETSVLVSAAERFDKVTRYINEHPEATKEELRGVLKTEQLSRTGTEAAEIKARQRVLQRFFPDGQTSPT